MDSQSIPPAPEEGSSRPQAHVAEKRQPIPGAVLWAHRLTALAFVCVCAGLGVLLLLLPWTSNWTDNHFLFAFPSLRSFFTNDFVRGVCSGLGLLDIWIGFSEALNYKEDHHA